MPLYNDLTAARPWLPSPTTNASIVLDQPGNVSFTNLDYVSGKVVVKCTKSIDIETVAVKLEGESRTRLLAPSGLEDRKPRPQLEYHKSLRDSLENHPKLSKYPIKMINVEQILYKVQVVFPPPEVLQGRSSYGAGKSTSTLPPGTHEWPFSFKLPFNNSCAIEQARTPTMNLSGIGLEISKAPSQHVKKTLPPTLTGFPGEAEIRYFVKATVTRHYFWKENPRVYAPFNFFPIEPPRPASSGSEVFARQRHSFQPFPEKGDAKSKVAGLFGKSKEPVSPTVGSAAPQIAVDARLPEPAILTCNEDIPLRLIVKRLNDCDALILLQSLEISLVDETRIRAHDVYRTEQNSWVIISRSNMNIPVGAISDPADTEFVVDDHMWRGQVLPKTVAPSFLTCNITRQYKLEIRIGFSYSGTSQSLPKPQSIVLPMRLDIEVYSGIAPPKELLEAMADTKASSHLRSSVDKSGKLGGKLQTNLPPDSIFSVPPTPMDATGANGTSDLPAQEGSRMPHAPGSGYVDAPPSYEDAIASNLPPINVPRPAYEPPPAGEDDLLRADEKKVLGRRDS